MKAVASYPVFAFGLLSILVASTQGKTLGGKLICTGLPADIIFVLDSSTSISDDDFKRQLKFVEYMIDHLDLGMGYNQIRIGVETFSNFSHVRIQLDDSTDKMSVKRRIDQIPRVYGNTNIGDALNMLQSTMLRPKYGSRANAKHVAIIITDGVSQDMKATQAAARKCRDANIQLFVIGIGRNISYSELEGISSRPHSRFLFLTPTYAALDRIRDDVIRQTCRIVGTPKKLVQTTPVYPDDCTTVKQTDVVFIVSNNHFGRMKTTRILKASAGIIRTVGLSGAFRFGSIFSNCLPNQDKPLGSVDHESQIVRFNHGSIAPLIHKMRTEAFSSGPWGVRQVGVLFLDDTIDLDDPEIKREVRHAIYQGIELHAVIIGDGVKEEILRTFIPSYERIIKIYSYNHLPYLPSKFRKTLCKREPNIY